MRVKIHSEWRYQVGIICLFCLLAQEQTEAPERWSSAEDGLGAIVAFIGSSFLNSVFYGFISSFICCSNCLILIFFCDRMKYGTFLRNIFPVFSFSKAVSNGIIYFYLECTSSFSVFSFNITNLPAACFSLPFSLIKHRAWSL